MALSWVRAASGRAWSLRRNQAPTTSGFAATKAGVVSSLPITPGRLPGLRITTRTKSITAESEGFRLTRYEAWVAPSASARTRSGCRSASSCAIIPPMEMPKTLAPPVPPRRGGTPTASSTATASSAISRILRKPSRVLEWPVPRLSKVMTKKCRASFSGSAPQPREETPMPMTSNRAGEERSPWVV